MRNFVKTTWDKIRDEVIHINPVFTEIVDNLNPGKDYHLYTASYSFGSIIGDEKSFYYPTESNNFCTASNLPSSIAKDLSYAGNSIPMGMLLSNSAELFIEDFDICIPIRLLKPGNFFGLLRELEEKGNSFHPAGLSKMSAGARSIFLLPNIGDAIKYSYLRRDYKIKTNAPRNLYEHWNIFKELYNFKAPKDNPWETSLLFFSQKWVDKMRHDKKWKELKLYLIEEEWKRNAFRINQSFFELIFSITQAKKNLKPNPYLADTTRHLLAIAVGSAPGFMPAIDESAGPIKAIQEAFLESYGIKYAPTIMHPGYFKHQNELANIYYSMNYPSTLAFSPKSRKESRVIIELRELKHITTKFLDDLKKENSVCSNTLAYKIINSIELDFFHNKNDMHDEILLSSNLTEKDNALQRNLVNKNVLPFADSGSFVRGCVRISTK